MATTVTATINVTCWKQHKCNGCGCDYRYVFVRQVSGTGDTEAAAEHAAHQNLVTTLSDECEYRPCPDCGQVQPDMIAHQRGTFSTMLWLAPTITFAVIMLLAGINIIPGFTYGVASVILMATAGLFALLTALKVMSDPNASLDSNRESVAVHLSDGSLERVNAGNQDNIEPPLKLATGAHWMVVGLLVAAAVLAGAAGIIKTLGGFPSNDTWLEVVGPGDTARIYFPNKIQSVKGYWAGRPSVDVPAQNGIEAIAFSTSTNRNSWGDQFSVKSSEKNQSATLWIDLIVPKDERLAGKTVNLTAKLDVTYPAIMGGNHFDDRSAQFARAMTLTFGPSQCGSMYSKAFWFGTAIGLVLLLAAAWIFSSLNNGLRERAQPPVIEPIEAGE